MGHAGRSLVVAVGLMALVSQATATRVLFVGGGGTATYGADGDVMAYLVTRYGTASALGDHGVFYKQATAAAAADATLVDVVILSSTPSSGDLRNKFEDTTTGLLNWEEAVYKTATGDFQMCTATAKPGGQTQIHVVDATNYITSVFPTGALTIASTGVTLSVGNGTIASGVTVLAEQVGTAASKALFLAETGAALLGDGTAGKPAAATGRRVMFPADDNAMGGLNADGYRLFGRAVDWAAGRDNLGYWRMEQDDDAGGGVSVPDTAGNNPMTRSSGDLDNDKPDSVMTNLLQNGLANTASLNGNGDVSGQIASYAALNSDSITVEFFARTGEGDAGFFTRSTGSDGLTFGSDGICIVDPDNLDVQYVIDDGAGGSTAIAWSGLYDTTGVWDHYAFTYDQTSGVGTLYINGVTWARNDGPDGRALIWGAGTTDIRVGWGMDGGGGLSTTDQGLFDELRISNIALAPDQLLYRAPAIAGDSFAIQGRPGGYSQNRLIVNAANQTAVAGTVGFSADKPWTGGNTSNIELRSDGPDGGGLTHSLLADEKTGCIRLKAKDPRDARRTLSARIPDAPVYYMSALLQSQKAEPGLDMSVGFSTAAADRSRGIHIGFSGDKLAMFAGAATYTITDGPCELGTTYLVIVRLTTDLSGLDKVEAYVARDGDATIEWEKEALIETFSSTADLANLKFRIVANGVSDDRLWWVDEPRLATSPAALGVDPALMIFRGQGTLFMIR